MEKLSPSEIQNKLSNLLQLIEELKQVEDSELEKQFKDYAITFNNTNRNIAPYLLKQILFNRITYYPQEYIDSLYPQL